MAMEADHERTGELLARVCWLEEDRARIEQEDAALRARLQQLERANRELDEFACLASHDLKEPLHGISAYCEILRDEYRDKLDGEGRHRLDTLVKLCDRLAGLIDDLLTYSRVGKVDCHARQVDLNRVVDETLEVLRPAIGQRGASVRVRDRLPRVSGDATLLGMTLANLVSNGLKFNQSERPQVEIGCVAGDPPTIYVRDNGIGIAAEHHQAIFTIFRRLHGRRQYQGSGAGLTIARKIVESHGGRIWLESEPGRGSTFFFTLGPGREAPSTKSPAKPPHWLEHSGQRSMTKRHRR